MYDIHVCVCPPLYHGVFVLEGVCEGLVQARVGVELVDIARQGTERGLRTLTPVLTQAQRDRVRNEEDRRRRA